MNVFSTSYPFERCLVVPYCPIILINYFLKTTDYLLSVSTRNLHLIFEIWFVFLFKPIDIFGQYCINCLFEYNLHLLYLLFTIQIPSNLGNQNCFKVWSNQHVIFCTFCFDWHKRLYGYDLIHFSVLKTTHVMSSLIKGSGYINKDFNLLLFSNNLLFFFFSALSSLCSVPTSLTDLSNGWNSSICKNNEN